MPKPPAAAGKILLNYFNENLPDGCGNCDSCRNPKKTFDGTTLAQKALSASIRLREEVGVTTLVQVLRGSASQDILEKGYHQIKTYGAGRDVSANDWRDYIHQMLNIGVFEMAYDQNYALKQGPLAPDILYKNQKVYLIEPRTRAAQPTPATLEERGPSNAKLFAQELFEQLKALRKQLAQEQQVPPYVIFNDKTLDEMAKTQPTTPEAFLNISGVAQAKLERYGPHFLPFIQKFIAEKMQTGENIVKGGTYILTLQMYQQGLSLEAIAQQRDLSLGTIQGHLVKLYEQGHPIDLEQYLTDEEREEIWQFLRTRDPNEASMKPAFEHFEEKYDYFKLRIAGALMKEESSKRKT
ncbi:MAG: RecQ family ATP-dependent DNA helicase [Bacteroidia bacterium]|nr:RecQ family ATP-dependent DNA helicase [Bacteroidia bacterium]